MAGEYSISQLPAGTHQLTVQALANSFRAFENYRTPKASRTNPGYSSLREIIGEVSSATTRSSGCVVPLCSQLAVVQWETASANGSIPMRSFTAP